jgi:uncharacterized damage-inducible protein DinB
MDVEISMTHRLVLALAVAGMGCATLAAQSSNPLSEEARHAYEGVKKNILGAADAMPDADYSFKATPVVRSFAQIVEHVVQAQTHTCAAFNGETKTASISATSPKAEIVAALKESFADCDKAYGSLTDATAAQMVKSGRGERTRLGLLVGNTTHDVEQYSAMAVYMRLKGLVPPSSQR